MPIPWRLMPPAVLPSLLLAVAGCAPGAPAGSGSGSGAGRVVTPAPDAALPSADGGGSPSALGLEDRDGDGTPDAVEELAGTDPDSAFENPLAHGDFVFHVPYLGAPSPSRDTVVMGTEITQADVYFLMDTSWSMQGQINAVRDSITGTILPGLLAEIDDVQVGAGEFDVCPEMNGLTGRHQVDCAGIGNGASITSDVEAVRSALSGMTANCGTPEPYGQGVWLFATGDTSRWPTLAPRDCPYGPDEDAYVGYPCVRPSALPILVVIGDEPYREGERCATASPGAFVPSQSDVTAAMNEIGGKLVVMGNTGNSAEWGDIARGTGSVDAMGRPLIFPGVAAGTDIVDAVTTLAAQIPLDVSARVRDLDDGDGDDVDATIFVDRIEPNLEGGVTDARGTGLVCVGGLSTMGDSFVDVAPGTTVCFDVIPAMNETEVGGIYRARLEVVGEGVTVLDTRTIYFIVGPEGDAPY